MTEPNFIRSKRWIARDVVTGLYFSGVGEPPIGLRWTEAPSLAYSTMTQEAYRDRVFPLLRQHGVDPSILVMFDVEFVRPAGTATPWLVRDPEESQCLAS